MSRELVIMMAGDVYIGPWSGHGTPQPDREPYKLLEAVAPYLQQGNITLCNLEGPVIEKTKPPAETIGAMTSTGVRRPNYPWRMPPKALEALKRAGFDAVCIANNISQRFGSEGIIETVSFLDQYGIAHAGGGRNLTEARKPAIVEKDGVRLALLSYTTIGHTAVAKAESGGVVYIRVKTALEISETMLENPGSWPRVVTTTVPEDKAMVLEDVRQAKEQADVVVVGWHWGVYKHLAAMAMGVPLQRVPDVVVDYQEEMGRACIDAGADLIMGHSPHRLQGMEVYRGALICYSLCNLAFTHRLDNFGQESCIVKAYLDPRSKKFIRYSLLPVRFTEDSYEAHVCPAKEAGDIIRLLEDLSEKYGTRFETAQDEVSISPVCSQRKWDHSGH